MHKNNEELNDTSRQEEATEHDADTLEKAAPLSHEEETFKSQFMRVNADFANYKRRVEIERTQWMKTAKASVITSFLSTLDDLERALNAVQLDDENDQAKQILEGVQLIHKNINKVMSDLGVEEIRCDAGFDPELHEALMQAESDAHETGQIVTVLSKGYTFKGDVIRHAKVSVAK